MAGPVPRPTITAHWPPTFDCDCTLRRVSCRHVVHACDHASHGTRASALARGVRLERVDCGCSSNITRRPVWRVMLTAESGMAAMCPTRVLRSRALDTRTRPIGDRHADRPLPESRHSLVLPRSGSASPSRGRPIGSAGISKPSPRAAHPRHAEVGVLCRRSTTNSAWLV